MDLENLQNPCITYTVRYQNMYKYGCKSVLLNYNPHNCLFQMPKLEEPYYCSEQINIPPELPDILKQFTKSAIRTQPKDVLAWSAA